jgi:hypothetical protein
MAQLILAVAAVRGRVTAQKQVTAAQELSSLDIQTQRQSQLAEV